MTQLDDVLEQFHADLARAGHLLRLVKEFRAFAGSQVPTELGSGQVPWAEAVALAQTAPAVRTDLPILSGSLLLYLCGRFEYFIREVIVSLADDIASRVSSYVDLPVRLREELRVRTLEVASNPGRFGYNETEADQLIDTLAQSLSISPQASPPATIRISSSVLAITDANMNSRVVAEVFKRVDFTDFWSEVGKQAPLKAHVAQAEDRQCKVEAIARLEALMKQRNSVAHPTATTTFPDPDQVLDSVKFLKVLSQVIIDLARIPR